MSTCPWWPTSISIPARLLPPAVTADKVRINPGNFVDPGRVFKKLEYTDEEYAAELAADRRRPDAFFWSFAARTVRRYA